jgi:hypothetical protein
MGEYDAFHGLLIPVFCTVDVPAKVRFPDPSPTLPQSIRHYLPPPQLLSKLLTRVETLTETFSTGLYFVRSKKVELAVKPETQATCTHFRSPFEGSSLEDIVAWFDDAIDERKLEDRLAVNSLIILDERTLRDESTALVVSTLGNETRTARAEFWVAAEVLIPPEMGPMALNEGFTEEEERTFKRRGEWWYTRADWQRLVGEDEEEGEE